TASASPRASVCACALSPTFGSVCNPWALRISRARSGSRTRLRWRWRTSFERIKNTHRAASVLRLANEARGRRVGAHFFEHARPELAGRDLAVLTHARTRLALARWCLLLFLRRASEGEQGENDEGESRRAHHVRISDVQITSSDVK